MKTLIVAVLALLAFQASDRLSESEVAAAALAKPNTGFVFIEDGGFITPSACPTQMPSEAIFTPEGWINAKAATAKQQFLPYTASPEDTLRTLKVVSRGCVAGTPAGPVCDSITRVVLLSDRVGTTVIEASVTKPFTSSWQNGFGASTTCSSLRSEFPVSELHKVRNEKGEFQIATFAGSTLLKIYTVKQKHLKQLGL